MKLLESFPPLRSFGTSTKTECVALHSGNLGDIVYAIPTLKKLEVTRVTLNVCNDPYFAGRILTTESAQLMAQFLVTQEIVESATVIQSNLPFEYADLRILGVDYVLDRFRSKGLDPRLHLVYQHAIPFNISVDASKAWLTRHSGANTKVNIECPFIVIGMTPRYRRVDNGFYEQLLRDISPEHIVFLGTPFDQMERCSIQGQYIQTSNFEELVEVLSKASLFIGNPSFLLSLAEGLKITRWIEVPDNGNVYPLDKTGDLVHQHSAFMLRNRIANLLGLNHDYTLESERRALIDQINALKLQNQNLLSLGDYNGPVVPYRKRYQSVDRLFRLLGRS